MGRDGHNEARNARRIEIPVVLGLEEVSQPGGRIENTDTCGMLDAHAGIGEVPVSARREGDGGLDGGVEAVAFVPVGTGLTVIEEHVGTVDQIGGEVRHLRRPAGRGRVPYEPVHVE